MRQISFHITILEVFAALVIAIVFSVTYSFYTGHKKSIFALSNQIVDSTSEKVIEKTMNFLNEPAKLLVFNASDLKDQKIMGRHQKIWKKYWDQLLLFPQLDSIFVADKQGSYVQVRRYPELATRFIDRTRKIPLERWIFRNQEYQTVKEKNVAPDFDPRTRPWYKGTLEAPRVYWTGVYVFTTTKMAGITATYPIASEGDGRALISSINISLTSLSHFISTLKVSPNALVFIFNEVGEVVAYPDVQYTMKRDELKGNIKSAVVSELPHEAVKAAHLLFLEKKDRLSFPLQVKDETYLAQFRPFPKDFPNSWTIGIVLPESDLLGQAQKTLFNSLMFSTVILLIALVIIYWTTNRIAEPLVQLAKQAGAFRDFRLEKVTGVKSSFREIRQMSDALLSSTKGLLAFRKYVPADLVRQLIDTNQEAKIGGKSVELTMFFSDVENFTSVSEMLSPEKLMEHLSNYLDVVSGPLIVENATIDKYTGDGVMAFWGAPHPMEDHAYRACSAALVAREKIRELNEKWIASAQAPLYTRMGIHTDTVVVGNMGSKDRMNYSIVGDGVNVTSRLEGINKIYGTSIIISEKTYKLVGDIFLCRELDRVSLKGKTNPMGIYELVCFRTMATREDTEFCKEFERGLNLYFDKKMKEAATCFKELLVQRKKDLSVQLMLDRCDHSKLS